MQHSLTPTRHENPFWNELGRHGNAIALIDGASGAKWTYLDLAARVETVSLELASSRKKLIVLPLNNSIEDIVFFLGALASGHVTYIYSDQTSPIGLKSILDRYRPDIVAGPAISLAVDLPYSVVTQGSGALGIRQDASGLEFHGSLTLLLSTSGSTGSSKLVRLSRSNLISSAMQVREALRVLPTDRSITTVPLAYVYGLSVLFSHLSVGASIVVDSRSVMEKSFWQTIKEAQVTTFSGVPWTYQMLKGIDFAKAAYPSLLNFTTAGAKVDQQTMEWMDRNLGGARIYYMYGQTEACGRIAVLPSELVSAKKGSVGAAVCGGRLECEADGTIIYSGPNVMLGYALSVDDLKVGDALQGRLDTGDIGYLDQDGCLFITGRKSRICKIYGIRVNLDDVQNWFSDDKLEVIACEKPSGAITLGCCGQMDADMDTKIARLASHLGIPKSAIHTEVVDQLKRSPTGKLVYDQIH